MVVGGSSRVHLLSESHIAPTAEAPEQLCLVVLLAWSACVGYTGVQSHLARGTGPCTRRRLRTCAPCP